MQHNLIQYIHTYIHSVICATAIAAWCPSTCLSVCKWQPRHPLRWYNNLVIPLLEMVRQLPCHLYQWHQQPNNCDWERKWRTSCKSCEMWNTSGSRSDCWTLMSHEKLLSTPWRTAASDVTSNELGRAMPRHRECLSCVCCSSTNHHHRCRRHRRLRHRHHDHQHCSVLISQYGTHYMPLHYHARRVGYRLGVEDSYALPERRRDDCYPRRRQ